MIKVGIISYGAGNIKSVAFALERLGVDPIITADHHILKGVDKVIFPGVGEAQTVMNELKKKNLDALIPTLKQPVLGICLGMQVLCSHSDEGNTTCMGLIGEKVISFSHDIKVPHMGWNLISCNQLEPLFSNLGSKPYVYFAHSFFLKENDHSIASTEYGSRFSSAVRKDNFYGVQFHPEKSGKTGHQILKNFIEL